MKVQVILGSVRESRSGERVAKWVVDAAEKMDGWDVELVDFKDYVDLPAYTEPIHPAMRKEPYTNVTANRWSEKLAEGDAYVFITAEYNYSVPGAFKNAIDYLYSEIAGKPAAIVSYSGTPTAGIRAAAHLQAALANFGLFVTPATVSIGQVNTAIDEEGELNAELAANPMGPNSRLDNQLGQLAKLAQTTAVPVTV
jgi:NAD(P)H-dependent FMN reductase